MDVLGWLAAVAPTAVAIAVATVAWRRAQADLPGGDGIVTAIFFAAAAATGWFTSLALLGAIGPALPPGAVIATIHVDPLHSTFFGIGADAQYVGGIATMEVLAGLGPWPTTWSAASTTAGYIPLVALAALVTTGCHAMLVEDPTRPSVSTASFVAASTCVVFGVLQQAFANLASTAAAQEIAGADAFPDINGRSFGGLGAQDLIANPWPFGAFVALFALGVLVKRARAITAKTDGLV